MCLYPKYDFKVLKKDGTVGKYDLPCGKCLECQQQYSREWAFRCALEASLHQENCMLTLTYAETDGSLHKDDYQKFIKRLRKCISPVKIKYFLSGEYGTKNTHRPHYHIIIFGWMPKDMIYIKRTRGNIPLYTSSTLDKLWTKGYITCQEFDFKGAKYCAKYLMKFLDFSDEVKQHPFTAMSNGIGKEAFEYKFLEQDKIYINGQYIKLPRYYLKKLDDIFSNSTDDAGTLFERSELKDMLDALKERRLKKMHYYKNDPKNLNKEKILLGKI